MLLNFRRTILQNLAIIQNNNPIRNVSSKVHFMCDDKHRHFCLSCQFPYHIGVKGSAVGSGRLEGERFRSEAVHPNVLAGLAEFLYVLK